MEKTGRFNRNFLLLWQGQLVSQVGSQVFALAGLLWLKHATESTLLVALLSAAFVVPGLLFAPLGGVLADRYPRRLVLVVCDAVRGVAVLLLGLIWFTLPPAHPVSLAGQFILTVIVGATSAVFQPTGAAFVPDLVTREALPRANSALQSSFQCVTLLAQSLSGVLLRVVGAPILAMVDAASYCYSAVSSLLIRQEAGAAARPAGRGVARRSFRAELRAVFAYVRATTGLWGVMLVNAGFKFFLAPFTVLFAFYVEGHLHASGDWYGFLLAALGVGAIGGFALAGLVTLGPRRDGLAIVGALVGLSVFLGSLSLAKSPAQAFVLVALAGVMNGYANVKVTTLLQLAVVPEMRGRVFGVFATVTQALVPIATVLAAFASDLSGRNVAIVYAGCGAAMAATALVMAASRSCRAFLRGEGAAAADAPLAGAHGLAATAAGGR